MSSLQFVIVYFGQICFADRRDAGCEEMIRILPFDRIRIFPRHLTIFCVEGIHPATYAIPETDSDDLILAGTADYKHPAIIDIFTKQMAIASKSSDPDTLVLAFHSGQNRF